RESLTGLEFIALPSGLFRMGQSEAEQAELLRVHGEEKYSQWFLRELPPHVVSLEGFLMARLPVTLGMFREFVEQTLHVTDAEREGSSFGPGPGGWQERPGVNWRNPGFAQGEDHPVVCVSWFDAMTFAGWLSRVTGRRLTLPSEAQWEYACRAGTTTPFHLGPIIDAEQANYDGSGVYGGGRKGINRRATTPAGSFSPNPWGLFDMHGNVWEWCLDGFDDSFYTHPEATRPNPLCAHGTGYRVRRGGSWSYPPTYLRSAYRGRNHPDSRYVDIGFRLVCLP
ncbi:MAG: formylglycine-generating enzyme family protein, partial [Magnetococcales bacterium]|nr:formylglycine-generating enzyme family protein [Magnetococcales bacterium]